MNPAEAEYCELLSDGYIVRWGTTADIASLRQLYGSVFGEEVDTGFNHYVVAYVDGLLSGKHPHCSPDDFAVVTDTTGRVVAATILMRMNMEYAGAFLLGGRPEIVASYPEVRNRGFIRKIFGLIHARSEARGDVFQGITGIPYYYKQFGYDYAVTLGGAVSIPKSAIPAVTDKPDPYSLRTASKEDILQLQMLYERERSRMHQRLPLLASSRIDAAYWRWAISDTGSHEPWRPYMIIDNNGDIAGSIGLSRVRSSEEVVISFFATEPHVRLAEVYPSVLRAIETLAPTLPVWDSRSKPWSGIRAMLGVAHPLYAFLEQGHHTTSPAYGWYIRVADMPRLIGNIATVLERRLGQSGYAGYSGSVLLDFYRGGLEIRITQGRVHANSWPGTPGSHAAYPPQVFLQQVFGIHSLEELKAAHMDVRANPTATQLLDILFPKQSSWVLPMD